MTAPSSLVFDYPLVIRESHLDTFGHVNNAAYLQIFEEARWELITQRGWGLDTVRTKGLGPTILQIDIKFLKEMRLRMKVIVKTQLQSYEKKIGILRQWIEDESGTVLCDARLTFGLFDVNARRLVLPTPEWLQAVGAAVSG